MDIESLVQSLLQDAGAWGQASGPARGRARPHNVIIVGNDTSYKVSLMSRLTQKQLVCEKPDPRYDVLTVASEDTRLPVSCLALGASRSFQASAGDLVKNDGQFYTHVVVAAECSDASAAVTDIKEWARIVQGMFQSVGGRPDSLTFLLTGASDLLNVESQARKITLNTVRAVACLHGAGVFTVAGTDDLGSVCRYLTRVMTLLAEGAAGEEERAGLPPAPAFVADDSEPRLVIPTGADSPTLIARTDSAEECFHRCDQLFAKHVFQEPRDSGDVFGSLDEYLAYVTRATKCDDKDLDALV